MNYVYYKAQGNDLGSDIQIFHQVTVIRGGSAFFKFKFQVVNIQFNTGFWECILTLGDFHKKQTEKEQQKTLMDMCSFTFKIICINRSNFMSHLQESLIY